MLIAAQNHSKAYWLVLEHGANVQNVPTRRNGPRPETRRRDLLGRDRDRDETLVSLETDSRPRPHRWLNNDQYVSLGPNLQNFVRQTYENVTKKSDIRKVYEKNVRKNYEKRTIAYWLAYERHAKELRKNYDVSWVYLTKFCKLGPWSRKRDSGSQMSWLRIRWTSAMTECYQVSLQRDARKFVSFTPLRYRCTARRVSTQ